MMTIEQLIGELQRLPKHRPVYVRDTVHEEHGPVTLYKPAERIEDVSDSLGYGVALRGD